MTVRFGHLFPTWLAQTFAVTGYTGLVRLNVVLGALSLLAIYGLGRRLLPAAVASVFTLFLAFNPSQIWTTRNTLTEVLTQLLVWTAVLLLTAYLARGQTRIGLWAGILLGLSAVVRIDALLLLPLLLVAHALWVVVSARGKPSQDQSWAPIYLGAVPIFVVAVAYYAVFSRPYLLDLEPQLRQIGLLTVVAGVLLGLSFVPDASRIVHRVIVGRAFYLVLIVGLAALAGYAYVLRPILPPFGVIDAPGHPLDGTRSHVEDALPNLAVYLSPPVIGAAVAGWWFTFVDATHGRRERVLLPLLLLGIGFSVGYIWSQSIYPDHFWAIRRFVPVVIPSFLLFAGIGLTVGLRLLSGRLRRTVLTLTTVVLAATTFLLGVSTYFVTEREGSYAALTEFASSISPDETFLGLADQFESNAWFTPLYLAFDRHIVPIDVTTAEGRAEAIGRLQTASPGNPIALVTTRVDEMAAVTGPRRAETHVSRPLIVVTTKPVPRLVWQEAVTLTSVQATGLSTTSVRFGGQPSWLVAESGFYDPEVTEGSSGRWTDGHGRLDIPVAGPLPTLVTVSLAETGPQGSDVRLVLNGSVLFDGHVAAGPWSGAFEAVGIQPDGMASLEIVSNTFHPETPTPGLEVEGELGVKVDGVVLIAGRE